MVDKRTPILRGEALGSGTTGPADTSRCNLNKYSQETLRQQEEHDRRAMAGSILNVGVTTEVEANPVTIGGDRPPKVFCGFIAFQQITRNYSCLSRITSSRWVSFSNMEET